jgi:hypothetical protein
MAGALLTACGTAATPTPESDSHPKPGPAPDTSGVTIRRLTSSPPAEAGAPRSPGPSGPEFPPKNLASFRAFAATGNSAQVHQIGTSSEGLPSCPTPNVYVTVNSGAAGRRLEADLAAFFLRSGLIGGQCQAFVFAYHSRGDYQAHRDDGYTVGRVALTNGSGSGSERNLEVDTGEVTSETYNPKTQFAFDF